jgi:four helix bundle protein
MATIEKFEDIISWQEARKLNKIVGDLIDNGRFKRSFKLINQVESSAGSVMDNIAEGFERNGNKEFKQFLYVAKGSCGELRSQLHRALDRNYITRDEFETFTNHARKISGLIQKLINYLEESALKGPKFKKKDLPLSPTDQS